MVEISPQLVCLFSAALEEHTDGGATSESTTNRRTSAGSGRAEAPTSSGGPGTDGTPETYTVDVPRRAVENGQLEPGRTYRVAILEQVDRAGTDRGADRDGGAGATAGVGAGTGRGSRGAGSTGEEPGSSDADRRERGSGGTGGTVGGHSDGKSGRGSGSTPGGDGGRPEPPVDEGEVRTVTVEAEGDQGDGIAKVERGYVVIVPGAEPGDQPTVEITTVRQNVAFAELRD